MQIHELNKSIKEGLGDLVGPSGLIARAKTGLKTLQQQPGAAAALGQLPAGNTFNMVHSNWNDLYRRTKSDMATQQWINGLNKLWKTQAGVNMSLNRADQQIDEYGNAPNNSVDPRRAGGVPNSVANLKAQRLARNAKPAAAEPEKQAQPQPQQQAQAQTKSVPMSDFKNKFLTWTDQRLKNNYATMDQVRKDPQINASLNQALTAVEKAQNSPDWDTAFTNYMMLATTGIRALSQANQAQSAQKPATDNASPAPTSQGNQIPDKRVTNLLTSMGVQNPTMDTIRRLKERLEDEGLNSSVGSTGSPSLDALLQQMGHL